jgi:hypothetical protein
MPKWIEPLVYCVLVFGAVLLWSSAIAIECVYLAVQLAKRWYFDRFGDFLGLRL